jgi:hypothetical protein
MNVKWGLFDGGTRESDAVAEEVDGEDEYDQSSLYACMKIE